MSDAETTTGTTGTHAGAEAEPAVHHVVLTGGPGAGKTTALAHLTTELTARGWRVLVVPEAATVLVTSGLRDLAEIATRDPATFATIQDTITATQVAFRHTYDALARALASAAGTGAVVLHDRGVADNAAYVPHETYTAVLDRAGLDHASVLDLYDAVLHLRSAAVPAPGYDASAYTRANNVARTEDAAAAAALDAATLDGWAAHPHLFVIGSAEKFADKLDRTLAGVLTLLGDPDPVEIERKYLLADAPDLADPVLADALVVRIEQTYLAAPSGEQRVRARTANGTTTYTHTTKVDLDPLRRIEIDKTIGRETYDLLRTLAAPGSLTVVKNRRIFFDGDHRFELDEFCTPNVGWVCEVELIDAGEQVTLPACLGDVTDVTDDPAWRNHSLAHAAGDHART